MSTTIKTKKNRLSIISIHGEIHANEGKNGINPDQLRQYFESCVKNKSEVIILDINSPGGSPVGSAMIHNMILSLREKGIKVFAHCRDLCASGGYMIVSACDQIYAYRSSLIGSIGVIMKGFGIDQLMEKHHVEYREVTAGDHKSFFNMFKAYTEKDKEYLENIIQDVHQDFIDMVYASRKNEKMTELKSEIIRAKVFNGKQALEHGLIDDFKSIREIIKDNFDDEKKVKIHRPKVKENFIKKLISYGIKVNLDIDSLKQGLKF